VTKADSFLELGNEYLIAYAQVSATPVVSVFLLGHATELYLKAVLISKGVDLERLIQSGKGHDLVDLLSRCKKLDPRIPVTFNFRDSVLNALLKTGGVRIDDKLSNDDHAHFCEYEDLYYAAYAKADLKYFGTRMKKELVMISFSYPTNMVKLMVEIFDPIREYLGYQDDVGTVIRRRCQQWYVATSSVDSLLAEYDLTKKSQQSNSA
jgi:HEPN domain-containing protein